MSRPAPASAADQAQDRESLQAKDRRSTTVPCNQPQGGTGYPRFRAFKMDMAWQWCWGLFLQSCWTLGRNLKVL